MMGLKINSLVLSLLALTLTLQPMASLAKDDVPQPPFSQPFPILSYPALKHDTSLPLSTMQPAQQAERSFLHKKEKAIARKATFNHITDSAIQTRIGQTTTLVQQLNFPGISSESVERSVPDVNGAVGATQYVQHVNGGLAIYDKKTGQLLYGPAPISTLWQHFGKPCESNTNGDPIVLYDKKADRFVLTTIARDNDDSFKYQCIAVSTSSDALGSYHRYAFDVEAPDYTKLGIWPDGYYLGINGGPNKTGLPNDNPNRVPPVNLCVVDRSKMLNGDAATMQCANIFTSLAYISNPQPSDFDGTPPPNGTPNYFAVMDFEKFEMRFYPFHVDWNDPKQSRVLEPVLVPVSPFKPFLCDSQSPDGDDGSPSYCVSQPNTKIKLDSLTDFLMNRLSYRYFNDGTAALMVNHTVAAKNETAGIRWYEFKINQDQSISIKQQGTYTPDTTSRWNGSMTMDKMGNIALGYTASSDTVFPSVRITGREATDPGNQLQNEKNIINGNVASLYSRFGDYSGMVIDPIDDCTFWYTGQYITDKKNPSSNFNWATTIVSAKFPNCK